MKESAAATPQGRLITAVLDILMAEGVRGVSARALAERAGASASAVNYHFGGREGLLAAAFEHASRQAAEWRTRVLAAAPEAAPPESLASWLQALIQDLCRQRSPILAVREFRQLAARMPSLRATAARDQAAADAFWSEVCARSGLPERCGATLSDFAAGATLVHGPEADWIQELPWLSQTCMRFAARLSGRRADLPGWDGWRANAERRGAASAGDWRPPTSEAAVRMLDAAIEIVGLHGVEGLTHRAVAQVATASLANVTHHFPSQASLVHATFRCLHERATEEGASNRRASPSSLSPRTIADSFVDFLLKPGGDLHPAATALEELILFSAREPELAGVARQLRAGRGEGSMRLLDEMVQAGDALDRLDAHMISTLLMGSIRGVYGLEPLERDAWLRPRARMNLEGLFGAGAASDAGEGCVSAVR
ncbi:TetR/AcrR family transcriptional regulator [Phenylobacterium deserti]|uniref:HTH tetR-type domain-containing protein n=1 Tax=Phenylobacterium deserti TaxID=1914756 RepID=A0A328ACX0_9CAUL|nr:TetR family transcriptional regulator [Phenylobacterium deserti]RAK52663.1 hypothetical protein DJ018_10715 [Phenylobacterium deserti]